MTARILTACLLMALGCSGPDPLSANRSQSTTEPAVANSTTKLATGTLRLRRPEPVTYPQLRNFIRIADTLYSGGEPESEQAFADLARLGVKVVISVDGARPNIHAARKHGLRYVHIPIGYDGIPDDAQRALTRVARESRESGNSLYFHCHHGKHRGPAAAAMACIAAGVVDNTSAPQILEQAGTGKEYPGLWRDVTAFRPPPLDADFPELVEVAEVDSIVTAMSQLDHAFDNLEACRAAKWKTPTDHPDVVAAQEALLVKEGLHEIGRTMVGGYDEAFVSWLGDAEELAAKLEHELKAGDASAADQTYVGLDQACQRCHAKYRN